MNLAVEGSRTNVYIVGISDTEDTEGTFLPKPSHIPAFLPFSGLLPSLMSSLEYLHQKPGVQRSNRLAEHVWPGDAAQNQAI